MYELTICSHGQITDLTDGFSLSGGKPFSIFLKPKRPVAENTTVNCRCLHDGSMSPLPVIVGDWTPAKILQLGANSVDFSDFDLYWGASK